MGSLDFPRHTNKYETPLASTPYECERSLKLELSRFFQTSRFEEDIAEEFDDQKVVISDLPAARVLHCKKGIKGESSIRLQSPNRPVGKKVFPVKRIN